MPHDDRRVVLSRSRWGKAQLFLIQGRERTVFIFGAASRLFSGLNKKKIIFLCISWAPLVDVSHGLVHVALRAYCHTPTVSRTRILLLPTWTSHGADEKDFLVVWTRPISKSYYGSAHQKIKQCHLDAPRSFPLSSTLLSPGTLGREKEFQQATSCQQKTHSTVQYWYLEPMQH